MHQSRREIQRSSIFDRVTFVNSGEIRSAAQALHSFVESYSLRVAIWHDISSPEQLMDEEGNCLNADVFGWTGVGEKWWENRSLALESPLPEACRYESEPFWCNSRGFFSPWPNEHFDSIDTSPYFEKEQSFQSAILVPKHLARGKVSASCLVPLDPKKTDLEAVFNDHVDVLAQAIRKFVRSYHAAIHKDGFLFHEKSLSRHEVCCLVWAARGKTDQEIADILYRSHATVRYHITRAGEKLNTVGRAQTLARAAQLGYLP